VIYGLDSAYPSRDPRGLVDMGYGFVCGYFGGRALNVWTRNDWQAHAAAGLKLGPIWVSPSGNPPRDQGVDQGNTALLALQMVGLSGLAILDIENGATPREYTIGFVEACHAGSCAVGMYGSRTTINAIGDVLGEGDVWWLAEWVQSGTRLWTAPPDWSMWQFATGPQFDYNVARDDFPFASFDAG
jgi:hypothetical protein